MTESILTSIKETLGIPAADTAFDQDIMMHINSAFMVLSQLGIGPSPVFNITDATAVWDDFLNQPSDYAVVKTYIYLRVKLVFDPPASSFVLAAYEKQLDEYAWRLMTEVPTTPSV